MMKLGAPMWKVRRELGRLSQQLRAVLEFFYEPFLRWQHDRERTKRLKVTQGALAPLRKVAVYLVFQPRGIAESSLLTCRHLAAGGYAPLVVSNATLSQSDRLRLQTVSWKVVERPNFGYDFGGYRDGIWLLDQWDEKPESLILLNDSIWFPALAGDQTIAKMESMATDFRGILKLGTGEGTMLRRGREPFMGSFFLMFSAKALQSEAFSQFWRHYLNTSNKYKTIRRGERRLSYVMRDAGFEATSLFDRTHFNQWLDDLDTPSLRRLLDELVTVDPSTALMITAIASAHDSADTKRREALRIQILSAINTATEGSNILSSAPVLILRDFGIPFVKKAPDPWNRKALERLVTYHRAHPDSLPLPRCVAMELEGELNRFPNSQPLR